MIECTISAAELQTVQHPLLIPAAIMEKLRAAGIPVEGILVFRGLGAGSLHWTENLDGTILFRWYDMSDFSSSEPKIAPEPKSWMSRISSQIGRLRSRALGF